MAKVQFSLKSGDGQLFFIEHADRIEDTQGGDAGIGKDGSPHGSIAGKPGNHDDALPPRRHNCPHLYILSIPDI